MRTAGHCKIWTLSEDQNEYERFERLLSGSGTHHLDVPGINQVLLEQSLDQLRGQLPVTVIHDPSDIRKPHADQMEGLDTVRSLDGKFIPGYKTFNSIAIEGESRRLHLLGCTPKEEVAEDTEAGVKGISFRDQQAAQIRRCSEGLRRRMPDRVVIHCLDREYDDQAIFKLIDKDLGDKFVIRLKLNRNAPERGRDSDTGEEVALKLKDRHLAHSFRQYYEKFSWGERVYHGVSAYFSYDTVYVGEDYYGVVRVELRNREGERVFKEPMLLLTNFVLNADEVALLAYRVYLRRSKIEGVFKFLKEHLGWETFQVRDLQAIQHIIVLCFFIGGYFYEIESELVQNAWMNQICQLGGGKGKVSRVFFLRGLAKIANYLEIKKLMQEHNLSEDQLKSFFSQDDTFA